MHDLHNDKMKPAQVKERQFISIIVSILERAGYEVKLEKRINNHIADLEVSNEASAYLGEVKLYQSETPMYPQVKRGASMICLLTRGANQKVSDNISITYNRRVIYRPLLITNSVLPDKMRVALEKDLGCSELSILDLSNLLFLTNGDAALVQKLLAASPFFGGDVAGKRPRGFHVASSGDSLRLAAGDEETDSIQRLINEFKSIGPGRENSTEFENLCAKALNRLFRDELALWEVQRSSFDGLYRMDCICRVKSGNVSEVWKIFQEHFNSKYVVFEFKNYSNPITQNEIYTTEKYLFRTALRSVAIIISPEEIGRSAKKAVEGVLRESGKLIISLSKTDIIDMLQKYQEGGSPADLLLDKLDAFLIGLGK